MAFVCNIIWTKRVSVFQVPDNAVMALVPKQVTAYNSVNNSTVSRTSASKYGKLTCFCTSSSFSDICVSFSHFVIQNRLDWYLKVTTEGKEQQKIIIFKYSDKASVTWCKWATNVYFCLYHMHKVGKTIPNCIINVAD